MNKLREIEEYLRTWLERVKQANKVAPIIQETYEEVSWARQALDGRPSEAVDLPTTQIDQWAEETHKNIKTLLPQIPRFDTNAVIQVNSMTTSANSAVAVYVYGVGELEKPATIKWATEQTSIYKALQEKHTRPARVRDLLANRWPQVLDRFDVAVTAYRNCGTNTEGIAAAALEMRTALDAVQGELFAEARSNQGEKMTWDIMATRLTQDPVRQQVLLNQGSIRSTLRDHLSGVAKRRPEAQTLGIDTLWTMWLDHLLVILT